MMIEIWCWLADRPAAAYAVLFSALFALIAAMVAVAKNRIIAKRLAAKQFIMEPWRNNKEKEEAVFDFFKNYSEKDVFGENISDETLTVQQYLNTFEMLAVLIDQDVIDENICKLIIGDSLIKVWRKAHPFIGELRAHTGDDEFYEHFENLASKWKTEPQPVRRSWLRIVFRDYFKI